MRPPTLHPKTSHAMPDYTPIWVRRKNTRDRPSRAKKADRPSRAENAVDPATGPQVPQRWSARAPKRVLSTTSPRMTRKRKMAGLPGALDAPAASQHRRLSPLERLPTELLEQVFLSSMNLHLPNASPHIGTRLSSEHVYTSFALDAFCPRSDAPDPVVQSAVLSRRWMTPDRFDRILVQWARRLDVEVMRCSPVEDGSDAGMCAVCYGYGVSVSDLCVDTWLVHLADGALIPPGLLRPPFTHERLQLLRKLMELGAGIDWLGSTTGEIASASLREAVLGRDVEAVDYLTRIELGLHIGHELLRLAVLDAGCEQAIVHDLIERGADPIPGWSTIRWDDAELWAWSHAHDLPWLRKGLMYVRHATWSHLDLAAGSVTPRGRRLGWRCTASSCPGTAPSLYPSTTARIRIPHLRPYLLHPRTRHGVVASIARERQSATSGCRSGTCTLDDLKRNELMKRYPE
ncbi:MAG: hypothetical protein M1832_002464 [Thelocarpon impressellum]|nr:MAG: hypothetical protein M1832_002464 [Thelocarpon impressellum]